MTRPAVAETIRTVTLLGLAPHDLVTDTRITDGLVVTARPAAGGRVSTAFRTRAGVYAFRGLAGMGAAEFPLAGADESSTPTTPFLVTMVDLRGRFVDTVLRVPVPVDGLVTQGLVTGADSVPEPDVPVHLFSAPSRTLPPSPSLAVVRAQVAAAATGEPAAFCRLDVVVNPDLPGRRRYVGIADATGAVVVPFAYPPFGAVPGSLASPPEPGTRGERPVDRTWPVAIGVRHRPGDLQHHDGLPAPVLHSVLGQAVAPVWPGTDGPGELRADLRFGTELVLRTRGDRRSRLLVGGLSP